MMSVEASFYEAHMGCSQIERLVRCAENPETGVGPTFIFVIYFLIFNLEKYGLLIVTRREKTYNDALRQEHWRQIQRECP